MGRESVISIKNLSVTYDRKKAISNVYLEIGSGNIVGVLGPNGAGKSTLFKAVLGLIDDFVGEVKVNGEKASASLKKIAYVPQKNEVDWSFPATVYDVVSMGRYPHLGLFDGIGKKDKEIINQAIEEMGMSAFRDRQIGALSGGQQQRVFLARALCQEAEIILLDEPFVGVDALTETRIIQLLKKLSAQDKTILVIHHDLSTVFDYFEELVLLNQRLVAYGKTDLVFTEDNLKHAFGGQSPILHKLENL